MIAPLDVFAVHGSEPKWLGEAGTLAEAIELIRKTGVGSYFVYSQTTQHKNFYNVSSDGVVSLDAGEAMA
jgi:hypothetical protein